MRMRRPVVVTGAAGFIGSHLCERLLGAGTAVVGVDNFCPSYDPAAKRRNLDAALADSGFTLVKADIRDGDALADVFQTHRPRMVFHLAAAPGVRRSTECPAYYAAVNVTGTVNVLEAARRSGVEKIVFASSSSVYANNAKVPFSEDDRTDQPISPYAATKRSGEVLGHAYHHLYGMPIACLRIFTAYGPRQRPDLAIHRFLDRIDQGMPLHLFGDGSTSRDYTFVADLVTGILAAAERCDTYRVYNLGSTQPISLWDLVLTIEKVTERTAFVQHHPMQPGDVERTWADISRARRELGFEPSTTLEDGIAAQWAWLQARRSA